MEVGVWLRNLGLDKYEAEGAGGTTGRPDDLGRRLLWSEPRRSLERTWNAEKKDELEFRLRDLICSGQLDVVEAQKEISQDWTSAYERWFRTR